MRISVLLLLLVWQTFAQPIPIPIFSESGWWSERDQLIRFNVSLCNPGSETLQVPGNQIWDAAQRGNLAPQTRSQLQAVIGRSKRTSPGYVLRTVTLVTAGVTTGLQASNIIGKKWKDSYRAIAPSVGTGLTLVEVAISRQEHPDLEIPDDYLPATVEVTPGNCWVGSLIGRER